MLLGAPESVGTAVAAGAANAKSLADVAVGTMVSSFNEGVRAAGGGRTTGSDAGATAGVGRVGGEAVLERSSLADLRRSDLCANSSAASAFLDHFRASIHSS